MNNIEKNIKFLQAKMKERHEHSLMKALGIEITEVSADHVCGTMPVDERTHQYYGMLHGGASVALAETLSSCAASLHVNSDTHMVVGLEINANHIKSMTSGTVYGEAHPVHIGKKTQVWQIELRNEKKELICSSRSTIAVIEKK